MPTIAEFDGIKICMYADDHAPPHFHVLQAEHEALVRISDLGILAGGLPRPTLRKAMAWAQENQPMLALRWLQMNEG